MLINSASFIKFSLKFKVLFKKFFIQSDKQSEYEEILLVRISILKKRYAKWIHGEQNRIEIAKLNTRNGT